MEESLEITVVELTPARRDDFLAYFDRDAFTDNPGWAACYCYFPYAPHERENWDDRTALQNRADSAEMIDSGQMPGYLAYAGRRPIGWCSANIHARFTTLEGLPSEREQMGAIVCFNIAPPYRRMGVARRLLDVACAGFQQQGIRLVEVIARSDTDNPAANHHGPLAMYLAAGFKPWREEDHFVILRKSLE